MSDERPPYRWVVEALLFLLYMSFGVSWMAYAPLIKDLMEHFGVDKPTAGWLISLVSVSKAFVPLLAGMLATRIGLKRAILLGALFSASAILAPLAPSFPLLLAVRFVFGIGGAIIVTLMGAMAMEWFARDELPLVNGLNNVAVNTGITLALFITVPVADRLGWRQALTAFATLPIVFAVLWGLFGRDRPRAAGSAAAVDQPPARMADVIYRRETWLVALAFGGPLSLYLALNTWLPAHFQQAFGLDKAAASSATGLFNLVGIPSAILGGWLTIRLGLRRPIIIAAGLMMPVGAFTLCLSPNEMLRTAGAVLLGLSFFLATAPVFTVPTELPGLTSRHVALLNGVVFSVSYVVSSLSPVIVGKLSDATGSYVPGLSIWIVGSSVTALAGFLLPETGPRARPA